MSTAPEPAAVPAAGAGPVSKPREKFKSCWSCRILSGGGLIAAGLYASHGATATVRAGGPWTRGVQAALAFGACLGAWGVVVIADL